MMKGILKDEYDRQKSLLKEYEEEISQLPKGSLSIKTIKGKKYAYLMEWKGGKPTTDYIGSEESEKVLEIKIQVEKRKEIEALAKEARQLIKEFERGIRAKD